MKEDLDSLSWGRVLEIGKLLREQAADDEQGEYARELVAIAQSNLSLASRLGIVLAPAEDRVMASGMEIVEGGYAAAALGDRSPFAPEPARVFDEEADAGGPADGQPAEEDAGAVAPSDRARRAESGSLSDSGVSAESSVEAEPRGSALIASMEALRAFRVPDSADGEEAPVREAPAEAVVPIAAEVEPAGAPEAVSESKAKAAPKAEAAPAPEATSAPEAAPKAEAALVPEAAAVPEAASAPNPQVVPESHIASVPGPSADDVPDSAPKEHAAADADGAAPKARRRPPKEHFARFRNLYESRDGGLCVFEDERGHLVAVDSSKLA